MNGAMVALGLSGAWLEGPSRDWRAEKPLRLVRVPVLFAPPSEARPLPKVRYYGSILEFTHTPARCRMVLKSAPVPGRYQVNRQAIGRPAETANR